MNYTADEVMQYAAEEDVKFVRLAFCDIRGRQKNIAILPDELGRAFRYGIAIDASAIAGFGGEVHSDLFLHPDTSTLTFLPWLSEQGKVIRMFCHITYPDGTPFEADTRSILAKAVDCAHEQGVSFAFGSEMEFYLFKLDENGEPLSIHPHERNDATKLIEDFMLAANETVAQHFYWLAALLKQAVGAGLTARGLDENGEPTKLPYDNASYMDIAPEDKGENVRREVCFTLEQMGIKPESAHHEEGPGQNEIDFRYSDPVISADNAVTFRGVVNTVAARNGLCADFSPKPLENRSGNGMHINISVRSEDGGDALPQVIAGILSHISDMTVFLNTTEDSYLRFGSNKAPRYISWSSENRSQLIRIPAAEGEYRRAELRSPDPACNPYLAFALIIYAGLDGIRQDMALPEAADINLYTAPEDVRAKFAMLPSTLKKAQSAAARSSFIAASLPQAIIDFYTK